MCTIACLHIRYSIDWFGGIGGLLFNVIMDTSTAPLPAGETLLALVLFSEKWVFFVFLFSGS